MDGPAGRRNDNPPDSGRLEVHDRTISELTVQVYWQPGPPLWQRFGLDLDQDPKSRSANVANSTRSMFYL